MESDLYDSGASRHMTPFRHRLTNFTSIQSKPITAADKRIFHATGKGDMHIDLPNGNITTRILLKNVLYAPDMGLSIVSISRLAAAGYAALFRANFCRIFDQKQKLIGQVHVTPNGLYRMDYETTASLATAGQNSMTVEEFHARMGHISMQAAERLVKEGLVEGVKLEKGGGNGKDCESCAYAKLARKPIKKERQDPPAENFGNEIHSDLWGPSPTETLGHRKYYSTFTDGHSRWTTLELLRSKDETFQAYKNFEAWAETQHNAKIKRLWSNRGGEYLSDEFSQHLKSKGTERRLTTHDTPQHNGIAESLNRRLLERVRAMLHHSGLPKFLWGEAIIHAVWLKNRTSTRALENKTPFEVLTGNRPNLGGVPIWGTRVWVHDGSGSKLDGRAVEARWVGFDKESTNAHRIYWPEKRTIGVERNVSFIEGDEVEIDISGGMDDTRLEGERIPNADESSQECDKPRDIPEAEITKAPTPESTQSPDEPTTTEVPTTGRPKRQVRPSAYVQRLRDGKGTTEGVYRNGRPVGKDLPEGVQAGMAEEDWDNVEIGGVEFCMGAATQDAEGLDPQSLKEAKSRSDWPKWEEAMRKELESLKKNGTWDVVPQPPGKNIVGSKWVFHIKHDAQGNIEKHKARLVARGFTQVYGVDYTETFAPVAKMSSLRTILALAARHGWPIEVFDFNSAFLNSTLEEDIYMQLPPGAEGSDNQKLVAHLRKALYGLKQGGRA